jgi:hypothetical protein
MIHRRSALALLAGACAAPLASAIETQPTPKFLGGGGMVSPDGARSADPVGDSIPWETFAKTKEQEKTVKGFLWIVPIFPPELRRLDGQRVRVNGFMVPLEETPMTRRFLLTAFPPTCPFCLQMGSQFFIETLMTRPIKYTYDTVLIDGELELIDQDENGLFFRLRESRLARA